MSNKRDLKAYGRFDGTGRLVPGSVVLRKNKPKVGNWTEIEAYECCNDVTLYFTAESFAINYATLRFFCNGTQISYNYTAISSTDLNSLVGILRGAFPLVGDFSNYNDESVKLVMTGEMKKAMCPEGTLTFDVVPD